MLELLNLKRCRTQFDVDMALLTQTLRHVRLTEDGRIKVTKPYLPAEEHMAAYDRVMKEIGYISVSPRPEPQYVPDYVI